MSSEAVDRGGDGLRAIGRCGQGMNMPQRQYARILLVDDDPAIQRMVTKFLEDHDMHVVSAAQRVDVARHFEAGEPSLVILDLRLGDEDGLDLLREIRRRSDVPVIIMTAHRCDEIDRVVGLELGADDYVDKPFGLRELLARIGPCCGGRKAHASYRRGMRRVAAAGSVAGSSIAATVA